MRIEIKLHEEPRSDKVYWSAKAMHRVDSGSEEDCILQIVSETFIAGAGDELQKWYDRVNSRLWKELDKQGNKAIIRRMFLQN